MEKNGNSRKPVFQDYYTTKDYDDVTEKLPDIVKNAECIASEVLEPTIYEKRKVMSFVKDHIKNKGRKVYGGTALNELLKAKNPKDVIYDECHFSDIEFYSPTPVPDLVELCDALYQEGYKFVQGREAQHEETFSIFVNFEQYCDISYVPTRIYHGIKTVQIEDINYVDPHFIWIDYLRMYNDPMNSSWRWEKFFKRLYLLLKNYPPEYYNKNLQIPKPSGNISEIFSKISQEFLMVPEIQSFTIRSGFDAYNFYIKHAAHDKNVEKIARITYGNNKLESLISNIPYIELVSVNYSETVIRIFDFLKKNVADYHDLSVEEYFPLFQYVNFSIIIKYQNQPIVRIIEANGMCIPIVKVKSGLKYVSYGYILMSMLINRFRSYLDKNKEMYFNYGIAISNLIKARNIYLDENKLSPIDNSIFNEFKISCIGSTVSPMRLNLLRKRERHERGKRPNFVYTPAEFHKQPEEIKTKFDPKKYCCRNTSGNIITNPKKLKFKLDENYNLVENKETEEELSEEDTETTVEI